MNTVWKIFLVVAVVAGCAAVTPADLSAATPAPSAQGTRETVDLRFDDIVQYHDLQLSWLTLNDSRCPIGVTCVWAGQMVATVEVRCDGEVPVVAKLLHRVAREPEVAGAFGYELRLLEIDPRPKEGRKPARGSYRMRVEIFRP